jgi:hypothetical protein
MTPAPHLTTFAASTNLPKSSFQPVLLAVALPISIEWPGQLSRSILQAVVDSVGDRIAKSMTAGLVEPVSFENLAAGALGRGSEKSGFGRRFPSFCLNRAFHELRESQENRSRSRV